MPFVSIKDENGVERLTYESPQEQERQKQEAKKHGCAIRSRLKVFKQPAATG